MKSHVDISPILPCTFTALHGIDRCSRHSICHCEKTTRLSDHINKVSLGNGPTYLAGQSEVRGEQ